MKYILVASGLIVASLMATPTAAMAGMFGPNFDERVAAVEAKTEGLNNYHAYLARELAMIADAEKSQHDAADKEFLKLAEQAAAKAGGK